MIIMRIPSTVLRTEPEINNVPETPVRNPAVRTTHLRRRVHYHRTRNNTTSVYQGMGTVQSSYTVFDISNSRSLEIIFITMVIIIIIIISVYFTVVRIRVCGVVIFAW